LYFNTIALTAVNSSPVATVIFSLASVKYCNLAFGFRYQA
jgi:hypothetical protein